MDVKELRIGNIIQGMYDIDNESWCQCEVIALDSTGELMDYHIWVDGKSNSEVYYEFKPIEITER